MQSISITMGHTRAPPPPNPTRIQALKKARAREPPPWPQVYLSHMEGTKGPGASSGLIIQRGVGELPTPQKSLSKQRDIHYPWTNRTRLKTFASCHRGSDTKTLGLVTAAGAHQPKGSCSTLCLGIQGPSSCGMGSGQEYDHSVLSKQTNKTQQNKEGT